jgi:AP-1 complex subunit beta-1
MSIKGGGLEYFHGGFDSAGIKHCLSSPDPTIQIAAIKQVIANMTVGKDQSNHFTEIAKLVSSPHVQVKKLVYLYLMQNAKSQPEKAIMHAGSFVRDSMHENPLVRGIALRTMTSLQVSTMTPFANEVVMRGLRDSDPYVRRNAAFGVVKLYQTSPDVLQETGRIQDLLDLLTDPFASVVAAAVAAVCELVQIAPNSAALGQAVMSHSSTLLNALTECGEWSQVSLLEGIGLLFRDKLASANIALADAEATVDRVAPFLQVTNPAVVMAAVNVVVNFLQAFCHPKSKLSPMQQAELEKKHSNRIAAPLVSLTSTLRFEMRYVALRCIRVIVQRYKEQLVPHVKAFLVKFDDPIYIKLEKIDVMIALATRANAELILAELVEYATEVDVELVRKAVRCIGIIAVKISSIAAQCVERLVALIESRVSYIVQEAAVVVQHILRQYPATYESIIVKLCKSLDVLEDPESKAAVVWVIGEYAERIENVVDLMKLFFDGFNDETLLVQLAILTAAVKVFVSSGIPNEIRQSVLEQALALGTSSPIPDLRDRACFYWRLVLADPVAAARVVRAEKDRIIDSGAFDRGLVNELLRDIGRLSSVLHKPVTVAMGDARRVTRGHDEGSDDDHETEEQEGARIRAAKALEEGTVNAAKADNRVAAVDFTVADVPRNLIQAPPPTGLDYMAVLDGATAGQGLNIAMAWEAATPMPRLHTRFSLYGKQRPTAKVLVMQLNVNCWGLGFAEEFAPVDLTADKPVTISMAVNCGNQQRATEEIQVAIKAEPMGVLFFVAPPVPPHLMLAPAPAIEAAVYAATFGSLNVTWSIPASSSPTSSLSKLSPQSLRLKGLTLVHRQDDGNLIGLHLHAACINGAKMYTEVTLENMRVVLANVKSTDEMLGEFFGCYVLDALRQ